MKKLFRLSAFALSLILILSAFVGCALSDSVGEDFLDVPDNLPNAAVATETTDARIDENGSYTSKDDVALYIHTYGKLPANFIKKADAQKLGWNGGSLEPFAPGKSIGGDRFGNYEQLLPEKDGRTYTECDIDTAGASTRGAKRIVFSNDGLIFYTEDHYETFTQLYGGN